MTKYFKMIHVIVEKIGKIFVSGLVCCCTSGNNIIYQSSTDFKYLNQTEQKSFQGSFRADKFTSEKIDTALKDFMEDPSDHNRYILVYHCLGEYEATYFMFYNITVSADKDITLTRANNMSSGMYIRLTHDGKLSSSIHENFFDTVSDPLP